MSWIKVDFLKNHIRLNLCRESVNAPPHTLNSFQEECPQQWPNSHSKTWLNAVWEGWALETGRKRGRRAVLPRGRGSWKQINSSQISAWGKKSLSVVDNTLTSGKVTFGVFVQEFKCEQFPLLPLTSASLFTAARPINRKSHIPHIPGWVC